MKQTPILSPVMPNAETPRVAESLRLNERFAMTTPDAVFRAFLQRQAEEGRALARASDILELTCLPTGQHFIARYNCRGLVKGNDGVVREAELFQVGIYFGAGYLRTVQPFETLTLLDPLNVFHPNIAFGAPLICVGRIAPGMPLVDLIYQVYEILSYQRLTPREDDALNKEACRWSRANQARFPIDPRPLKRRALALAAERI